MFREVHVVPTFGHPRRPQAWTSMAAALLVLALTGSSCSGANSTSEVPTSARGTNVTVAPAGDPVPGGSLTIALSAETNGFSPVTSTWASQGYQVARAIFDPLAAFDKTGKLVPYLAESFTPNGDFTRWEIKVRSGVTFHDGTPFDAAALKKNLDAQRASATTGQTMTPIGDITIVDGRRVAVTMKEPWSSFPGDLAAQMGFIAARTRRASVIP